MNTFVKSIFILFAVIIGIFNNSAFSNPTDSRAEIEQMRIKHMSYLYDQMKKFKANGIVPKTCPKQPLYKLASCKHIQNLAKKEEIKKFEEWLNELREVYDKYDQCMAATASEIPIGKDKAKKRCGRIASIQERHIIRRGKLNELKF